MEGLDLGQTSNPSSAWKRNIFKINDDDDNDDDLVLATLKIRILSLPWLE